MGFFQKFQLGKVLGAAAKGFAQGGYAGLVAQGGAALVSSTANAASSRASRGTNMGGSLTTSYMPSQGVQFTQPSSSFPGSMGGGGTLTVSNRAVVPASTMDASIFNLLTRLVDRMGIRILSANAVIPAARRIIAGMIRFARRTPGMSLLGMLASAGLAADEANKLVSWWATSGKKHRRVRVTNVKALKRSIRRLEGFRKLSMRVEANLSHRRGPSRSRRCGKCRKSPCGC